MSAAGSQRDFAQALLDPSRAAPVGLRVGDGVDVQRRFAVHRNNAIAALVDALAATFPVTQALVGETFFRAMARERVRVDPPRSPILVNYGDGFADFIAGFAPAASVPCLADMARLEQLRVSAYHAADADPVDLAAYQALVATPERLAATRLTLHPACHWLHSDHALHAIWNAHQGRDHPHDADLTRIAFDVPVVVLVTRPQWQVCITTLPAGGIAWLDALRAGSTLADATRCIDGVGDTPPAARLEVLLTLIVRHGLAVALDSPPE